jgi:hypothetical protein
MPELMTESVEIQQGTAQASSRLNSWETFLRSADVPESSCASLVAGGTRKGNAIRSWIRENYSRRYVPENILEVLGLREQLVVRWQGEERESASSVATGGAFNLAR